MIPANDATNPDELTETGAFRILAECENLPPSVQATVAEPEPTSEAKPAICCPRCEEELLPGMTICCHCRLRLGVSGRVWNRVVKHASRAAKATRKSR